MEDRGHLVHALLIRSEPIDLRLAHATKRPAATRRGTRLSRREEVDATRATTLGAAQCRFGRGQQAFGIGRIFGEACDADRQRQLATAGHRLHSDGIAQARRLRERTGLGRLGQEQHELFTRVARDDITGSHAVWRFVLGENLRNAAQDVVADGVAEVVVHGRELIDVGNEQRHRLAVAICARDFFTQALLERAVRVEAGQRIAQRQRIELIAHLRELFGRRTDLATALRELGLEDPLVLAQLGVDGAQLVDEAVVVALELERVDEVFDRLK
jgi:hypothetical protein